ncbi:hypothetical protein FGL86_16220 [Pistricoccus aurantiacus]|uniref:Uncharacterized protein n=1 Tax=Pistricoccus aurantiacus TaxID=1883414 RepID=A0A5B8SUN7_9GAMM|nr:hypothetical protein [Pistricoccus aurantiacus]QEA40466.1 hypothetical protein FGL86_16220 [Pistricoccus aurantiacus]
MAQFLLVFTVSLLVIGGMVAIMMVARTPRYRTEPNTLLDIFDKTLAGDVSETQWHAVVGYPIRHDDYLESVRRRAQGLMQEYGQPWQAAQGGFLLARTGREELKILRDHLAARTALRNSRSS